LCHEAVPDFGRNGRCIQFQALLLLLCGRFEETSGVQRARSTPIFYLIICQSTKILAGFGIFWSAFVIILSFTQMSNSCTIAKDPTSFGGGSVCDAGVKTLCADTSKTLAFVMNAQWTNAALSTTPPGALFCGWPIGLTANRLFAGFLNLAFSIMHVISMINGRFLLAKTSAYSAALMPHGFTITVS
jgi:hypothetical protein